MSMTQGIQRQALTTLECRSEWGSNEVVDTLQVISSRDLSQRTSARGKSKK